VLAAAIKAVMEATKTSETSANYQITWRNIPEDKNNYTRRCEI
jgi:hypothetical protein